MATNGTASQPRFWPVQRLRGVRVLLVEDHEDLRELLAMALRGAGASVFEADGVTAAVTALQSEEFSVVVSDIAMPGRDGYDLLRWARSPDAPRTTRTIPAVAVTAFCSAADRAKALDAGFAEHVSKPVDMTKLIEIVASLAPVES